MKTKAFYTEILINSFFFASFLLVYAVSPINKNMYDCQKFIILIWLYVLIIRSFFINGFYSVYTLFLFFSAFFIYNALFFDLIDFNKIKEFTNITFPARHSFSDIIGSRFLFYSAVFFFIISIAYPIFLQRKNIFIEKIEGYFPREDSCKINFINKAVLVLMFLCFLISCYRGMITLNFARTHGYIYMILHGVDEDLLPAWTNGAVGVVYICFLVLFIRPQKMMLQVGMIMLLITYLFSALIGSRSTLMFQFFAILLLNALLVGKHTIKIRNLFVLFLLALFFSVYIGETRNNTDKSQKITFNENPILKLFAEQTNTRGVPLTVMEGDIPYHTYPFIFAQIIQGFGYSFKDRPSQIKFQNNINLLTCYKWNPKATLNGMGLGGAVIAEFIDFYGLLGVILGTIALAYILGILDRFFRIKKFFRPLGYAILQNALMLPRHYFFGWVAGIKYAIEALIIYYILEFIYDFSVLRLRRCADA